MCKSFKYNGKIWNPKNPDKKLKQLGITWDDVEIIEKTVKQVDKTEYERLYYFINKETGYSITSIYPICNEPGYEQTTIGTLETLWSKTRKI